MDQTDIGNAMGQATRGGPSMVFGWDKAAQRIKESGAVTASAGLRSDWDCTGGFIFRDGKPVTDYTFLASTWAVPELQLDEGALEACYTMQENTPGWDSETKWPASAL